MSIACLSACPSVFLRMRSARLAACVLLLATALAALPGHAEIGRAHV